MQIPDSLPAAYLAANPALAADARGQGGGAMPPPPGSAGPPVPDDGQRRQPVEQVLEGELLNEHRRGGDRREAETAREAQQRQFEQFQQRARQVDSAAPQNASAVEAYLTIAAFNSLGVIDYPHQVDLYV